MRIPGSFGPLCAFASLRETKNNLAHGAKQAFLSDFRFPASKTLVLSKGCAYLQNTLTAKGAKETLRRSPSDKVRKDMKFLTLIVLALITFCPPASSTDDLPKRFLPGWSADAIQKCRTPRELFDYMDGGAELYLEYRFKQLLMREYHHPQMGDITAEIWQFDEPADACGVFRLDPIGLPLNLGQEGRGPDSTGMGAIRFWKGTRYVRLFAWQAHDGLRASLDSLAQSLDALQPPAAMLPDWLARLDSAGLNPTFIRGEIALRNVAGWDAPDVSSIPLRSGAAWVKPPDSTAAPCLIIHATDEKLAEEILLKIQQQETARSSALERAGQNVIWVPKAADKEGCGEMMERVRGAL
jgi:hypothetical protein